MSRWTSQPQAVASHGGCDLGCVGQRRRRSLVEDQRGGCHPVGACRGWSGSDICRGLAIAGTDIRMALLTTAGNDLDPSASTLAASSAHSPGLCWGPFPCSCRTACCLRWRLRLQSRATATRGRWRQLRVCHELDRLRNREHRFHRRRTYTWRTRVPGR
jgi:hypothetical protein